MMFAPTFPTQLGEHFRRPSCTDLIHFLSRTAPSARALKDGRKSPARVVRFLPFVKQKSQITRELLLQRYMQFSTPHLVSNNGKRFSLYSTLLYARATLEYPFARGVEIRLQYYCDRGLHSSAFGDILRLTEPTRCGRVCFCSSWVVRSFVRMPSVLEFFSLRSFAELGSLSSSLLLGFCFDGGNSDFPVLKLLDRHE